MPGGPVPPGIFVVHGFHVEKPARLPTLVPSYE